MVVMDLRGVVGALEGFDGLDGVDVVGHLSVEGIVDPSGHVWIVGGGGGVCVCSGQDGSLGFALQSTSDGLMTCGVVCDH
jgi:hypothetical protein